MTTFTTLFEMPPGNILGTDSLVLGFDTTDAAYLNCVYIAQSNRQAAYAAATTQAQIDAADAAYFAAVVACGNEFNLQSAPNTEIALHPPQPLPVKRPPWTPHKTTHVKEK